MKIPTINANKGTLDAGMKVKELLARELSGWKTWQIAWMAFATLTILGVSLYQGETLIGVLTALTGVVCVILCGMGRVSNYFFGTINTLLYAYMAWKARYYGDVMLNMLYYFPTNIIGWIAWSQNVDSETHAVYKKRMSLKQNVLLAAFCVVGVFGYGYVLKLLGGALPIVDSASTVLSVIAQILMIKRYTEQWIVWIAVDVVSVVMWIVALRTEGASVAVLWMWCVFLANAIIMYVKWLRESSRQNQVD